MCIGLLAILLAVIYIAYIDVSYYFNFGPNISPNELPQLVKIDDKVNYKNVEIERNISKFFFSPAYIYHQESLNGMSVNTGYNESSPFFYRKNEYYDLNFDFRDLERYSFNAQIDMSGNMGNEIHLTIHKLKISHNDLINKIKSHSENEAVERVIWVKNPKQDIVVINLKKAISGNDMMLLADKGLGLEEWSKDKAILFEHYNAERAGLLDEKLINVLQVIIDKESNSVYVLNSVNPIEITDDKFEFKFVDNDFDLVTKSYEVLNKSGNWIESR